MLRYGRDRISPAQTAQWLSTRGRQVLGALTACALALSFSVLQPFAQIQKQVSRLSPLPSPTLREKYTPTLSPDGQRLAFVWNGGTGPHFNLYVEGRRH